MKTIRCLTVDDELNAHLVLKNYLERTDSFIHVAQCYHVDTALDRLAVEDVDLIFLDINMPDRSGFDFLSAKKENVPVILTTAYPEFALESYEHGVLDYLLKPFSYERFLKSLQRYQGSDKVTPLDGTESHIEMKVDGKILSFRLADILYIQSYGNYVKLYTDSETFVCASTTTEVEARLPKDMFLRIHKSYVVNLQNIASYDNEYVIVKNQAYLPVGITYRRGLSNIL